MAAWKEKLARVAWKHCQIHVGPWATFHKFPPITLWELLLADDRHKKGKTKYMQKLGGGPPTQPRLFLPYAGSPHVQVPLMCRFPPWAGFPMCRFPHVQVPTCAGSPHVQVPPMCRFPPWAGSPHEQVPPWAGSPYEQVPPHEQVPPMSRFPHEQVSPWAGSPLVQLLLLFPYQK